ncbi:putative ABC transport system permease protein [Enterobacter sp. BIGb0383]|uniref:ABC transporter permease n=1 Tax=unclassified Enterobacter TaxID=2608935 RepID=UPI000F47383B|nr:MULTISPECIES: ABC transporter permease [unclassified Enterobacter]ROP58178.1 putative ABC transport system permease protein [Enterobacter sp. BIGb0383]ROS06934.1 putative ABC transport system permease protein [Enterobacter sp. BIGb0359]
MSSTLPESRLPRGLLIQMAFRDLIHDRKVALCIIFSLIAVIAPLLLLFGLKNGVVSQLRHELLDDPQIREVRMTGNGSYDLAWLTTLAERPEVGFSIPLTRSLNTQADLVRDSRHFAANAEVIPTGKGDPLLGTLAIPQQATQAVLSASAARRLDVKVNDSFRLLVNRKIDGVNQKAQIALTVTGIVDEAKFARPGIFVTLPLLMALEDYRDGFQVPLLAVSEGQPAPERERFSRARLYARSLDDVAPLARWLEENHIESVTQSARIDAVRAIDSVLGMIFAVIAWISVSGCIASLVGAFIANIDRKRKDMAVLRLLGFRRRAVTVFIMIQALCLTGVAFGVGLILYFLGSALFNRLLGSSLPDRAFVCHLDAAHFATALVSVLVVALGVAGIGAVRALKIEPAESLREI